MKRIFTSILLIALFATCIALVACNEQTAAPNRPANTTNDNKETENIPDYCGIYNTIMPDSTECIVIKKDVLYLKNTIYQYEYRNTYFDINDNVTIASTNDLILEIYENGNLLTFGDLLSPNEYLYTFDEGTIPTRNGYFSATLKNYDMASYIDSMWSFEVDGTYTMVYPSYPIFNNSGTYSLQNGLLTIIGTYNMSDTSANQCLYIDTLYRIHTGAFVKDMSIFGREQTPSQPGDDNPTTPVDDNPTTPVDDNPTTPVDDNPSTHEHNYTAHVVPPTCTEEGYTEYVCSCGDSYKSDYTDALGHNYNSVVTEPTCTEQGYTTKTCSRCGDSYKTDTTSALGYHSYAKIGEPNIDTSCALSSTQQYKCSVCGNEITGFANIADGVSDCHNHLEVGETCEHCGYKVYFKNSDGMVLMDIGNNNLSAEFYGEHSKSMGSTLNSHITNVFFSDNVKIIEGDTASYCDNLNYIIIPENVLEIKSRALNNNRNLTYIDLPQHLYAYIDAFEYTPWYNNMETKIVDGFIYKENVLMGIDKKTSLPPTSVVLENDTIAIAQYTFEDCYFILSITIPNSVQSIGYFAFSNCSGLTSVILGDNVKTIGSYAFKGCDNLETITISNNILYIGDCAFSESYNLTTIVFGGTIAQWNAIEKGPVWDNNTRNYTVHCTDGDINKGE